MATAYIKLVTARNAGKQPVMDSIPFAKAENITTSATSQLASVAAPKQDYRDGNKKAYFWNILVIGNDGWVKCGGQDVEASAGNDHYVKDGEPLDLAISGDGVEYISVIDA